VSITVTPVNDAPVADSQSVTTPEDTAKAITLAGSDLDGDSLSFTVQTQPAHGTLSGTAPNLIYTPAANYNGADSFTFLANDGQTNSTVATVSITVTPVNDAPVADNQSVTTPEDTAKAITLTGSDLDGDSLSFTVQTQPAHGTLSGVAPNLTYTPAANYNGADSFTFLANDGQTNSAVATVSINVTPVNDAPVADNQSVTTAEDTAKSITLTGSDLDGDSLSFTVQTQPTHGTLSGTAPNLTYTPAANYNGPDSFTFLANDGQTNSAIATVSITVTPVNDAPVADSQSVTTPEDTAKAITLAGSDLDGDNLSFTVQTQPAHGTLSGVAPNLIYTPAANYNGPDSFTFLANDGQTNSAVATVSITVTPVNDPPNTNNWAGGNYTINEDSVLTVAVPGVLAGVVDEDADTLSVAVATSVAHGSLSLNPNGSFTYQPATNYNGADSFTFTISDGQTNVGPLTVNITVVPVNDAPSFVKGADRLLPENAPAQSIVGWASNISAGPANEADQVVTFQVSSDNPALFAVQPAVSANGTLTFTPAAGAFGAANVSVVARDNGGTANGGVDASAPQTFSITLNAPPTVSIASPTNGATFIGPVDFTVLANATDADGTVAQVELFVGTNRVAQITNGGPYFTVLTNVPPGTYQLSARATDDRGTVGVSTTNTVTVLEHPPIVTVAGIHLNPRTSLYEQTIRVLNPTYNAYPAVRVFVGNLAPEVRLFNISGVLNGVPYVQSNFPVPPGGHVDIIVQYYSTGGVLPNPALHAEIVPVEEGGGAVAVGGAAQPIRTGKMLANGTFQLEFGTQSNRVYAVQYSSDLKTWNTTPNAVAGNGSWYVWIDNGQPNTPSPPKDAKVRFYRVLLMP
jgi:VCBS repeat-containing protein